MPLLHYGTPARDQPVNHHDDRKHEQQMDDSTGYVEYPKPQEPQHKQDYSNSPEHLGTSFEKMWA